MKTILLTGASGFIGTHLLKAIQQHPEFSGYRVVLLTSKPQEGFTSILHNNYSFPQNAFQDEGVSKVDVVIHAGAFTPKSGAEANDVEKSNSNISSLQALLSALPNTPEQFVFLSTLDVYAANAAGTVSEQTATDPISLYGWSKLYGEKMLEAWAKQTGAIIQVLRIGHIYGSGEEAYQKIIPVTIRKALQGQAPVIFTKGEELRSFLHVSDCIRNILAALSLDAYKGPINIVSKRALPVKYIVQQIVEAVDPSLVVDIQGNDVPVRNLVFDSSKMEGLLGAETIVFEDGIREEIKNFRL